MLKKHKTPYKTMGIYLTEVNVYYTYACETCKKEQESVPILKTPVEPSVIPKSFASPEAVAYLMYQKYVMGSPIYRMERDFLRKDIMLSRQTMSNWMLRCSKDWLKPIYDALHGRLLKEEVLYADETTLQVLKEPNKKAQTKSYMWLYRTGKYTEYPTVLYEYRPDRKAENPKRFLEGFSGYLHADGYSGYHNLQNEIRVVGCLAHARRKFTDALKALPEKERSGSLAEEGLKYFANTPNGAQGSAVIFSIIETAKENGLDPYAYLVYIFQTAPKICAEENWATKLLPENAPENCRVK